MTVSPLVPNLLNNDVYANRSSESPSPKNRITPKKLDNPSVIIVDVGTGEGSIVKCVLDLKLGLVYEEFRHKIARLPSAREFAGNIINFLSSSELKDIHTIINLTSWARIKPKGENKRLLNVLMEVQRLYTNIVAKVITQHEEAKLSELSLKHTLQFINPELRKLINPLNAIQIEAGKGSTQSAAILPIQTEEMAGAWADKKLTQGERIFAVIQEYKNKLLPQMAPREVMEGKKVVAVQGLFANGLEDKNGKQILKSLEILTEEQESKWNSGQLPKPIDLVIAACENKVQVAEQNLMQALENARGNKNISARIFGNDESKQDYANDIKAANAFFKTTPNLDGVEAEEKQILEKLKKALSFPVPAALTLGILQAIVMQYGNNKLLITNHRNETPLFLENKAPITRINNDGKIEQIKVKVSGTHGAAIKHFIEQGYVDAIPVSKWLPAGSANWKLEEYTKLAVKPTAPEMKLD